MEVDCLQKIREHSKGVVFPMGKEVPVVKGDTIRYDRSLIIVQQCSEDVRLIFRKGLLFPGFILGARTDGSGSFSVSTIGFIGKLSIGSFKQLPTDVSTPANRVYSLLLWREGYANPSLYLLQLTNETARANTDAAGFINGARVTAFGFCSILI